MFRFVEYHVMAPKKTVVDAIIDKVANTHIIIDAADSLRRHYNPPD